MGPDRLIHLKDLCSLLRSLLSPLDCRFQAGKAYVSLVHCSSYCIGWMGGRMGGWTNEYTPSKSDALERCGPRDIGSPATKLQFERTSEVTTSMPSAVQRRTPAPCSFYLNTSSQGNSQSSVCPCPSPPPHTILQAPSACTENHKTISFLVVHALPLLIWPKFTLAFWEALH